MASTGPDVGKKCNPTNLEKRLLVWYKKYPSISAIPESVPIPMVYRVRDKARIHFNLLSMGVFSVAFLFAALAGRREMEAGKSVMQNNIDWHREYNDPKNVERVIPDIR